MRAALPSRFLAEIPSELVETVRGSMSEIGESRRYEPDPEYSYSADEFLKRVRGKSAAPTRTPPGRSPTPASTTSFSTIKRVSKADPLLGQKVRHPEYGVGTVVGVEGEDDDRRLSVSFPGRGTKKFIERYAQLQQI